MKECQWVAWMIVCLLVSGVRSESEEQVEMDDAKWGELAQLFMGQGFAFGARHDWDAIEMEEGPYMRAHEALNSARQGQESGVTQGIIQSANFRFPKTLTPQPGPGETQYFYSRVNNPNYEALERQISAWHDVRHKTSAKYPNDMLAHLGVDPISSSQFPSPKVVSFASGMGAISAVLGSILKNGDKMILAHELYYEVSDVGSLLGKLADIKMISIDVSDIEKVVDEASDTSVKILYLESASNPHGRIPDFDTLISRVRAVNQDIIVVVDNTWTTPVIFQPFRHDIDVVVESATKYLSGKGDAVLGLAIVYQHENALSTATEDDEIEISENRRQLLSSLPSQLRLWRRLLGSNPSPFNAWLISKGLETLPLRMEHLSIKTPEIADFISSLPPITRVLYCGSPSHPHFHLSQKYFNNGYCGGVLSFHLPLENDEQVELVMRSSSPFIPAPSFGEAQTLVMWPRKGSSKNFPEDDLSIFDIDSDHHHHQNHNMIHDINGYWFRLSIGLAPSDELKRDFFRWMTRIPFLTQSIASVDHKAFFRNQETGEVMIHLSKADWQQLASAPAPLFLKRQVIADIDDAAPHTVHPQPIRLKLVREIGVENVEIAFETLRPAHLASYVSYDAKYIISAFKDFHKK